MRAPRRRSLILTLTVALTLSLILFRGTVPRNPLTPTPLSQLAPRAMVTTRALDADIDAYVALVSSMHGDPFGVVTAEVFAAKVATLKRRAWEQHTDGLPLLDAYYVLQELAATLQDEHTEIPFPPHWDAAFTSAFPLRVRIIDDRAYVAASLGGDSIPPLAEIVAINGMPVSKMVADVIAYQGHTLAHFKRRAIESSFGRWLQAYFALGPPWTVTSRHNESLGTTVVRGMPIEAYRAATRTPEAYSASAMTVGDQQVPILRIARFSPPSIAAYHEFIDRFFADHRGKPYVVVDLRDNPGGSGALGWYVIDHLTDRPYEVVRRMTYCISETYQTYLEWDTRTVYHRRHIPRVLWWLPWYRHMDMYLGDDREKFLRAAPGSHLDADLGVRTRQAETLPYRGTVFVLTSHGTNSAAVVFAAAFKAAGLGLIAGQETGGRKRLTSDPVDVELPNTHLRATIPVALMVLPGSHPERGVLPDLPVDLTIDQLRRGGDPDLDAVRTHIIATMRARTEPAAQLGGRLPEPARLP
jgi:hypothetical protein